MVPAIIRLGLIALVAVLLLYGLYRILSRRSPYVCETCRHRGPMDRDGVLCRQGGREVFKNPVHIQNCHLYQSDPAARR